MHLTALVFPGFMMSVSITSPSLRSVTALIMIMVHLILRHPPQLGAMIRAAPYQLLIRRAVKVHRCRGLPVAIRVIRNKLHSSVLSIPI